jgi:hypothetical protein
LALAGWLSKSASWLWPAFKIGKSGLAGFQKFSAQLPEICYSIGAKILNSPVLKSFSQIQKLFALYSEALINSI